MTDRIKLHETVFEVEPIRNVVGVGNMAAYQIHVTRGRTLASFGQLPEFVSHSPANASRHDLAARSLHP